MKTVAIVAGGHVSVSLLGDISLHDVVIGVDRGAWWLLEHGIVPEYAIGDFDSVSAEELKKILHTSPNVVQYKPEKNETDLELAIQFATNMRGVRIHCFGIVGSRFDHSLAGIFLLESYKDIDISIRDENNELVVIEKEKTIVKRNDFPYCSIIPLTAKSQVTLEGFTYPLRKEYLYRNKTRGVSNELKNNRATIIVHTGKVICIQSRG